MGAGVCGRGNSMFLACAALLSECDIFNFCLCCCCCLLLVASCCCFCFFCCLILSSPNWVIGLSFCCIVSGPHAAASVAAGCLLLVAIVFMRLRLRLSSRRRNLPFAACNF